MRVFLLVASFQIDFLCIIHPYACYALNDGGDDGNGGDDGVVSQRNLLADGM